MRVGRTPAVSEGHRDSRAMEKLTLDDLDRRHWLKWLGLRRAGEGVVQEWLDEARSVLFRFVEL